MSKEELTLFYRMISFLKERSGNALELSLAGELGNSIGRAELMESFYCSQEDFSFDQSDFLLEPPPLPFKLESYRERKKQVFIFL